MLKKVKEYTELRAITKYYQFKSMRLSSVYVKNPTMKNKTDNEMTYKLYIKHLRELEKIDNEMKDNEEFWKAESIYSQENKDRLIAMSEGNF